MKLDSFFILFALLFFNAPASHAQDSDWLAIGVNAGFADEGDIKQYEFFTVYRLPWLWSLASGWSLETRLNATIGVLADNDETGAIISLGPELKLTNPGNKFYITIGSSPTYISEDRYREKDLGGHFQFTSHVSLGYRFNPDFSLAYRFHHISNASLDDTNPGLDVHSLSADYRF